MSRCHCLLFCAKQGVPTALVQPCASLLWQAPTCPFFFCSLDVTPKCILTCASLDEMPRPTRILLANVDPCDTEKLRRTCHGVNFTCSRSGSAHRKTSEPAASRLLAEIGHSLVQAWQSHMPDFLSISPPMYPAHENITLGMLWGAGTSLF